MTNPAYDIAYEAARYGATLRGEQFVEFVDIATIDHHRDRIRRSITNLRDTLMHLAAVRDRKVREQIKQDPLWGDGDFE